MTCFEIPGKPQGKGRARFGNGRTYTPEKTEDYMNLIRFCFNQAGGKLTDKPVEVYIIAYMPIPAGASKKVKEAIENGRVYPTVKPDNDNLEKVVFDALNGFAWHDDTQVITNHTVKKYSERSYTKVMICELDCDFYRKNGKWVENKGGVQNG